MIAIGTPFINLLNKDELNLTQYCVLYCYAYDKVYLLEEYFKKNKEDIKHVKPLIERNYLDISDGTKLTNITPTHKCISYIKDLVDSYDEFKIFHDTYPVTVIRKNGFKASLRENKKQCKELFIETLKNKKISANNLQKCLVFYLEEKKKGGDMAYLKTMRNFLKEETWRDVLEKMNITDNNKDVDYGGKLI
jgi:hypothetical protein